MIAFFGLLYVTNNAIKRKLCGFLLCAGVALLVGRMDAIKKQISDKIQSIFMADSIFSC
jgi:hypothetical protein